MRTLFFFLLIISLPAFSQRPKADPALFDFWVGEWDLTWKDPNGSIGTGMNIVTKILDGKVIQENFTGLTGQNKGYKGQSVSVLDGPSGEWKQKWVDNQNVFLPFIGGANGTSATSHKLSCKNIVHPEQAPHILRSFDAAIKKFEPCSG